MVSALLVVVKLVPVKMLPFDNKNEFLVLVDMPEGTTLEATDKVVNDLERVPCVRERSPGRGVVCGHRVAHGF